MSWGNTHMRKLHPDWKAAQRESEGVSYGIIMIVLFTIAVLPGGLGWFQMPAWLMVSLITLGIILFVGNVIYKPLIQYNRFQFFVSEEEIEIHKGWFFISETLIPMTKVQHVELEMGPILRRYDLAEVHIVTAATVHTIAGLKQNEAEQLKQRIGILARRNEE